MQLVKRSQISNCLYLQCSIETSGVLTVFNVELKQQQNNIPANSTLYIFDVGMKKRFGNLISFLVHRLKC